jgi:hypothetical protein
MTTSAILATRRPTKRTYFSSIEYSMAALSNGPVTVRGANDGADGQNLYWKFSRSRCSSISFIAKP